MHARRPGRRRAPTTSIRRRRPGEDDQRRTTALSGRPTASPTLDGKLNTQNLEVLRGNCPDFRRRRHPAPCARRKLLVVAAVARCRRNAEARGAPKRRQFWQGRSQAAPHGKDNETLRSIYGPKATHVDCNWRLRSRSTASARSPSIDFTLDFLERATRALYRDCFPAMPSSKRKLLVSRLAV